MRSLSTGTEPRPADRLTVIYLLLGFAQAAHSMEEMWTHLFDFFWTVTGILHTHFAAFPQFRMRAEVFAVLNMSFIAILLGTVLAVRARRRWAMFLAGMAGAIEVLNGIAHLSGAVYFGKYVPGAVTAPFLLVIGFLMLRELRRSGELTIGRRQEN